MVAVLQSIKYPVPQKGEKGSNPVACLYFLALIVAPAVVALWHFVYLAALF